MNRRLRTWLIASILVLLGVLVFFVVLLAGRAASATRIVMERWTETLGSPEEVSARYPAHERNAAADDLIDAASLFGLDIEPRRNLPRPVSPLEKRFKQFRAHGGNWLGKQLSKPSGELDPPPRGAVDFLAEFRDPLDRLEEALHDGRTPLWESDISQMFFAPTPNLLGHVDLNKVLLADSLVALQSGDRAHAERALEAAWQLGQGLENEPIMVVQNIRISMIRMQAEAVRHLPWLDHWIPRLQDRRYRDDIEQAMLHEGWAWPQLDLTSTPEDEWIFRRMKFAILGPWVRLSTADASERWRQTILELREIDPWCRPVRERLGMRLDIPMPWWNQVGEKLVSDVDSLVGHVAVAQLQMEMSRRLLEIDAARRRSGAWPEFDADWSRSESCPGDRWIYETDGEVASLRLDRTPETPADRPMTWSYSLSASTP